MNNSEAMAKRWLNHGSTTVKLLLNYRLTTAQLPFNNRFPIVFILTQIAISDKVRSVENLITKLMRGI